MGAGASRVCVGPGVRECECECVCVRVCVRGAGRSTHHLAGGARPLRGRTGNVEASLASSATCWLKHQLGQNKKLLKKIFSKLRKSSGGGGGGSPRPPARPPPPRLPGPGRSAHVSCYNYDYQ